MKRVTNGDLTRAITSVRPIVTQDMVREWLVRGLIPAQRNPGNDRGWWFVEAEPLRGALLKNIDLLPQEVDIVINMLGLADAGKQTRMPL